MRVPRTDFLPVRRDATIPTTVVVVTQVAAAANPTSSPTTQSTITVLKTITADSGTPAPAISVTNFPTSTSIVSNLVTSSVPSFSSVSSSISSSSSKTTQTSLASETAISSLLNPGSSSSTRLGLAIGIPIAAVSVFGLLVFVLIYLRKRMDRKPTETLAFKARKNMPKIVNEKHSLSSVYSSSDVEQGYEPGFEHNYQSRQVPAETGKNAQKPNFLKRISRLMNVPESPLEFKSPIFLRRFHLSNKYDDAKKEKALPKSPLSTNPYETTTSQSVKYPERETSAEFDGPGLVYVVVKPYARRLGDELSVCIGEKVTIVHHHSDGWATVKLAESGEVGVIPLMCIKNFLGK